MRAIGPGGACDRFAAAGLPFPMVCRDDVDANLIARVMTRGPAFHAATLSPAPWPAQCTGMGLR